MMFLTFNSISREIQRKWSFIFNKNSNHLQPPKYFCISRYSVFFSEVTKFKKITLEYHYIASLDFYYLLQKCRSEKKLTNLCLLVTTDPIYGILLPSCNRLHKQTKENPKETCNLKIRKFISIHFHSAY